MHSLCFVKHLPRETFEELKTSMRTFSKARCENRQSYTLGKPISEKRKKKKKRKRKGRLCVLPAPFSPLKLGNVLQTSTDPLNSPHNYPLQPMKHTGRHRFQSPTGSEFHGSTDPIKAFTIKLLAAKGISPGTRGAHQYHFFSCQMQTMKELYMKYCCRNLRF